MRARAISSRIPRSTAAIAHVIVGSANGSAELRHGLANVGRDLTDTPCQNIKIVILVEFQAPKSLSPGNAWASRPDCSSGLLIGERMLFLKRLNRIHQPGFAGQHLLRKLLQYPSRCSNRPRPITNSPTRFNSRSKRSRLTRMTSRSSGSFAIAAFALSLSSPCPAPASPVRPLAWTDRAGLRFKRGALFQTLQL